MRVNFVHKDVPFSTSAVKNTDKLESRQRRLTNEINRMNAVISALQLDFEDNEYAVNEFDLALEWEERLLSSRESALGAKTRATDKLGEDLVRLTALITRLEDFITRLEEKRDGLRSLISDNRAYIKESQNNLLKERSAHRVSKEYRELLRHAAKPAKIRHQLGKKIRENEARKSKLQERLSDVESTLKRLKEE